MITIQKVMFDEVKLSYNGKSGCMCGCRGKYSLRSEDQIEEQNEAVGYEAHDSSHVRPRAIKAAIRNINDAFDGLNNGMMFRDIGRTEHCAWVDDGNRNTVVYFMGGNYR